METNELKNKFTKETNLDVWAEYCCENQTSSYKDSFVAFLLVEIQLLCSEIDELKKHKKHLNEIISKQANQIEKLLEKKL